MILSKNKSEIALKAFFKNNKKEIIQINKTFVKLYNKIGLGHESHAGNFQLGFLMAICSSFIKSSNMPKTVKIKLITGLRTAINSNKI